MVTAEVVIMNRGAVALAADSAVTFQEGKIFYSANKLHMLAPGYPVGILVFNNSSLMSVSWEVIIKLFREYLLTNKKRFSLLEQYAEELVRFLWTNQKKLA
ncbi:MAG: hypothetical protein JW966_06255 [Anaerolineae bacterium]|nr:hypothetical protein [Anaerolineae bacterium]